MRKFKDGTRVICKRQERFPNVKLAAHHHLVPIGSKWIVHTNPYGWIREDGIVVQNPVSGRDHSYVQPAANFEECEIVILSSTITTIPL